MIGCYGLIHRHLTCHKRLNNYKIIGRNSKDLGSTRIVCKKESTTICSERNQSNYAISGIKFDKKHSIVKCKLYSRHREWFGTTNYALLHTSWCCTKLWHRGIHVETRMGHRKFGKSLRSRLDKQNK